MLTYLGQKIDFLAPRGAEALTAPDSVSWRVFKNPVTLAIGGVAAVFLELAHSQVRAGVWGHSSFSRKPLTRMRRTGLAAMITVYGPRAMAEAMIAKVSGMHDQVKGVTADGISYDASDPALLTWVQATASFGFVEAYAAYAAPLSAAQKDCFHAEGCEAARLYGAMDAPCSHAEQNALFTATAPSLEASPIISEFIAILHKALPAPASARTRLVRAAAEILPADLRSHIGLDAIRLSEKEHASIRRLARLADRMPLPLSPPVAACKRLGLPGDYLFKNSVASDGVCRQ